MDTQEALGQFQVQLRADGRSVHTRNQYERHVRGLIAWLEADNRPTRVQDITPVIVAEFLASDAARNSARGGTKKATSANAQRTSLRCFFRWAHESGIMASNVARLLKRARCTPPPPRALHDDEQERLLSVLAGAAGPEAERDRMLVELLLGTGIRLGSALALDIGDLDFPHGEIAVRRAKNDRPATVVMPRSLAERLRQFVGDRTRGPVFRAKGARRVSTRHTQRRLAAWMAKAGIAGKSAHSLRHSYAAALLAKTGDLRLVQAALCHASIVSTCIYTSVDRARLRAAIGA